MSIIQTMRAWTCGHAGKTKPNMDRGESFKSYHESWLYSLFLSTQQLTFFLHSVIGEQLPRWQSFLQACLHWRSFVHGEPQERRVASSAAGAPVVKVTVKHHTIVFKINPGLIHLLNSQLGGGATLLFPINSNPNPETGEGNRIYLELLFDDHYY